MPEIVFIDSEISVTTQDICDLGAVRPDKSSFHSASQAEFSRFVSEAEYVCGHNVIGFDLKYVGRLITGSYTPIDTLYLSPLLFPNRPYHKLLKDDKLQTEELNNPLNDSIKAMELFYDEVDAFRRLPKAMRRIFCALLSDKYEYSGFFKFIGMNGDYNAEKLIRKHFTGELCENAELSLLISNRPVELAYCLALINTGDRQSIIPQWVHRNFPAVEQVMRQLRSNPCGKCDYCRSALDLRAQLKSYFGYDNFRSYDGEPLQEKATTAAVGNKSLIAVFPTGGGKSVTFQLPALMAGEACRGLTVVISPLQSLMKDQVDNLAKKGIADAVTINGMLDPIERAQAFENVSSGLASLLYISPESLRSKSIEKLLLGRHISRFVIDEAHCFSAWGQDFRVDYLYIGDFIRELQEKKNLNYTIPVSCFTATAKQKVISDIRDYFQRKLGLTLDVYATGAARHNLRYEVIYKDNDEEKYLALRNLIEQKNCPTIVYVSKVKRTYELANKLCADGFSALPYNGKMESSQKIENQEKFMRDEVKIIVATSAFGMGVDKSDVKLVVHFDISASLEDYVQEAGRAGRDENIDAECYVLYKDDDLDGHFMMLNQSKLSIKEINQIWKAIKDNSRFRPKFTRSALELARDAGWNDSQDDIETRVRNAVNALETAGYVKRGKNMPRVFASSINVKSVIEANEIINKSHRLDDNQKMSASRIIKSMISARSIAEAGNADADSRIDYISDTLGIPMDEVIYCVDVMRQEGLLANAEDMTAYIRKGDTQNKSARVLSRYAKLESFLLSDISEEGHSYSLKELNEDAEINGITGTSVKAIKTLLYFWTIKNYIEKHHDSTEKDTPICPCYTISELKAKAEKRHAICEKVLEYLYQSAKEQTSSEKDEVMVEFSALKLLEYCNDNLRLVMSAEITMDEVKEALLYLSKISAINIEGGFLVLYNGMEITRLELNNNIRYKVEDYRQLDDYYKQKIQQIHIVGEYANMMVRDYDAAMQFVSDYFGMDYKKFIAQYFKGERGAQIERNITPARHKMIFDGLSDKQREIIDDNESKYIVVTAGPGSGKTMVLVRKLASLYQMEDTKHEQLLMVTFSRAAATEFRVRLQELLKGAARYVEIKTFHSYCFDLLGKIGSLENSDKVVEEATARIISGEVEQGQITKTVVVIDEAQDMDKNEFALVKALMERNEDMRVIAVGDDDQNIYQFRGSDSKHLASLITEYGAKQYSMTDNYRSSRRIVELANAFAERISVRLKSEPIRAVSEEEGIVQLTRHTGRNLEIPVVDCIQRTWNSGTAAVLTSTNDEALRVMGLLIKRGIRAKLIQSLKDFKLNTLAEVKYFVKMISADNDTPTIPKEQWERAKEQTKAYFDHSECLENVMNMISAFEATCGNSIYRSDFESFVYESKYEDFYSDDVGVVTVSTIHKAKGREFDNVYMLLSGADSSTDERKRVLYVGMTRAKKALYIHCNNGIFDGIEVEGMEHSSDNTTYPEPEEIVLQLGHSDVVLGDFKGKKPVVFSLQSGDKITLSNNALWTMYEGKLTKLASLSKNAKTDVTELLTKGYSPQMAKVRFIVDWHEKDTNVSAAVVLADVYFRKNA